MSALRNFSHTTRGASRASLKRQHADLSPDTLKKQASQQAAEYDRLADEHIIVTGARSDKKAD